MAKLRAKAATDKVYVDTSDDLLTFAFTRKVAPLTTTVKVLRNGRSIGVEFTLTGKDSAYALERARFEGMISTD